MSTTKIATCTYCGTRAALVLTGKTRHELACSSCGAPLHDLKMLRADHVEDRTRIKASPLHKWHAPERPKAKRPKKHRPKKRKKSIRDKFFDEALDFIEDIFD